MIGLSVDIPWAREYKELNAEFYDSHLMYECQFLLCVHLVNSFIKECFNFTSAFSSLSVISYCSISIFPHCILCLN